ncbi:oplophorus-luciferin 2-monooxygenase non-catalytic subunit-like [Penaeus japonicus]|uniref:oplophorus-luciferin 2-monooxygenase non-catalytic subunit-like n=1 Tax=Penaeus japonicus TaxID=27405 RepID=UPI001C7118F6|nr:oplophorus-luciferin 2-monooxygenase non-catalytic subunit-like [Penaeus japonicus]
MNVCSFFIVLLCACNYHGITGEGLRKSHPFFRDFEPASPVHTAERESKLHPSRTKHLPPIYLLNQAGGGDDLKAQSDAEPLPSLSSAKRRSKLSDLSVSEEEMSSEVDSELRISKLVSYREEDRRHDCEGTTTRVVTSVAPVPLPGPKTCQRSAKKDEGVLLPNVCDKCPRTEANLNALDPCLCVGNNGSSAGMISITCPTSMATLDQLESILTTPNYITNDVFRFTLKGSNVSGVLTQDTLGNLTFHQVVFEGNQITQVDNKAFARSAETLTFLSLYNNQITYYVTNGQNDLPNLSTLVLKQNQITVIFASAFSYASLTELDLSHNKIATIGKDAFAALNKLKNLNLSYNQLTRLEDCWFNFYDHHPDTNFLEIDLSHNSIAYIEEKAFPGLRNVQIDLRYNQLTTLSEAVFRPIIIDSDYFAHFILEGNPVVCDCSIMWVVEDPFIPICFDNFICPNLDLPLWVVKPGDLGNCSRI